MNPLKHAATAVGALALLATLPACQSTSGGPSASPGIQASAIDPTDTVAISTLRESAISVVEESWTSPDPQIRANAVEASGLAPARFKNVISGGLSDPIPGVRAVACMTIGRYKLADLAPRCRGLLNDESQAVRLAAIYALARNELDVDQSPLASALLTEPSLLRRGQAAFILGELGNPSAIPMLRSAAAKRFPGERNEEGKLFQLQVAEAMIKLGEDSQRPFVRAALYPASPDELESTALAVQILGQVGDRAAVGQMIYLSAYRDAAGQMYPPEVRLGIAAALASLGNTRGGFIADEYANAADPRIRAQSAFVYGETAGPTNGRLDPESLGKLSAMLKDGDPAVRLSAAYGVLRALGRGTGRRG